MDKTLEGNPSLTLMEGDGAATRALHHLWFNLTIFFPQTVPWWPFRCH